MYRSAIFLLVALLASSAHAAISLRTAVEAANAAATSVSLTRAAGTGEGDFMLVTLQVESRTAAQITAPAGWTAIGAVANSNSVYAQVAFYRFAATADVSGASPTWTWSWTGSREYTATLLVLRGVDAAAPVNATNVSLATNTAAAVSVPAVTPSVSGTMLLGVGGINRGTAFAWTAPMGEASDIASGAAGGNITHTVAIENGPAAGVSSGTRTATAGGTDNRRVGQMIALAPAALPAAALRWRFDEAGWSGVANEVRDASGNGLAGRAFGAGATPTTTAANNGNAAFCRSGLFSGASSQYVETANQASLSPTSRFTVTAWVRPASWPAAGGRMTVVSKDTNYEFHLTSTGALNWRWSAGANAITTPANALPLNAWTHVAIVYARGAQEVFINGALAAQNWANPDRNATASNTLPFQAGSDQGAAGRYFDGQIEEVRVYDYAMSAADVLAVRNEVPAPICPLDHFALTAGGGATASTCLAKSFSITAQDVNNATYTNYTGDANIFTSSGRGDWANAGGSGILSNGAANDGSAQYSFAVGDAGSAPLALTNRSQDDLAVSVVDSADPSITGASSTVNFRDNALIFSEDLSGRIAGSDVAVAGRAHDFRATYIYKDSVTANCGTLTSYTGAKNLKAWVNRSGSDPGGAAPSIGAQSLPNAAPGANNLTLAFSAGVADFSLATSDVGQYAINLRDDAPGVANTAVSGSSGVLTVRPFTLAVSDIRQGSTTNPGSNAPAQALFAAAGTPFQMTVGAYRHSAAADANDDGVPDAGASLAQVTAGGVVPAFAGTASFNAAAPFTPAAGGTLANGSFAITGGSATPTNLSFSEVGSFSLSTASVVPSYLGIAGLDLAATVFDASGVQTTAAPVIGRFRPEHFFLQAVGVPTNRADAACAPPSGFTYMDETMQVTFTLRARNAAGQPTVNYTSASGFAKLNPATIAQLGLGAVSGTTPLTSRLDLGGGSTGSFVAGDAAVTATLAVARAVPDDPDGPYPSTRFGIAPVDSDGTTIRASDFDMDADATGANDHNQVGSTEIRYGRLRLQNAAGNGAVSVPVDAIAQYWNGSAFDTNTLDSCTTLSRDEITLAFAPGMALDPCETRVSASSVTFSAGTARIMLTAPGSANAGRVTVSPNLDSADGSYCNGSSYVAAGDAQKGYLLGRWNNGPDPDGNPATSYDDEPAASVSFGVYGAQPPNVIFFRENY